MDSDEIDIEEFYRNWLRLNTPQNAAPTVSRDETVSPVQNIIFENNMFQLYVEKGNKKLLLNFYWLL
jgi:hypothetical protein